MENDGNSIRAPRLCSMLRQVQGYGFNLHGEKGVAGQFISAVDKGGPADLAGLCVGDRVVEVNNSNVEEATHAQVVAKIKENQQKTILLVVDKVTDEYLSKLGIPITVDLINHDTVLGLGGENHDEDNTANVYEEVLDHEEILSSKSHNSVEPDVDLAESMASPVTATHENDIVEDKDITNHNYEAEDNVSDTQSSNSFNDTRRGSDMDYKNGYPAPSNPERISQSSSEDSFQQESGRTSSSSDKLSMAAALPKPRRTKIKEDKSESWASKAARFNNL